jgi:predicted small lipoprotein YifL
MPHTNLPHPEERPRGARLQGRTALMPAVIGRVLVILVVVLTLAGCGKKGAPQPPANEPNTYPRTYPSA